MKKMMENKNEDRIEEAKVPERENEGISFDIEEGSDLQKTSGVLAGLQDKLLHNENVPLEQINALRNALQSVKVDLGGEKYPLLELANVPDLKFNLEIWKEILEGDRHNIEDLTFLIPGVARKLKGAHIYLDKIKSLSPEVAEVLSETASQAIFPGNSYLSLNALTELSPASAKNLGLYPGNLTLGGFIALPAGVAEGLAGNESTLSFPNVSTLSFDTAQKLSRYKSCLELKGLQGVAPEITRELLLGDMHALKISSEPFKYPDAGSDLSKSKINSLEIRTGQLDVTFAEVLAQFRGQLLTLKDVGELTPSIVEKLNICDNRWLSLWGATISSSETAEMLSKRKSKLDLLDIRGVSDEALEILCKIPNIGLSSSHTVTHLKIRKLMPR